MRRHLPLLLLLLLALAGCGDDADDKGDGWGGSGGDGEGGSLWGGPGGPLADAGPDQRLLEGMPARLDGRGSLVGEEGLPLRWLWTQEAGPRVALDDPTSPVAWFVTPPIRSRQDTLLVFRLTVDDGSRLSTDRMTVNLVDHPLAMLPAPVALAGADQEVLVGTEVSLGSPLLLDPACHSEGGGTGCEADAELPFKWTQIDGPTVALSANGDFLAPEREAVLTFRLDAHRPAADQTGGCGPGPAPATAAICSAPDYVRIFVRQQRPGGRLDEALDAIVQTPSPLAPAGGMIRLIPMEAHNSAQKAVQTVTCYERARATGSGVANQIGYRPLLGDPPLGRLNQRLLELDSELHPPIGSISKRWPGVQAVAYEARVHRLRSAPVPVLISWEHPDGGLILADAGPTPCGGGGSCPPFVGGDRVELLGSATVSGGPPEGTLSWCWEQTLGPPVRFEEGDGCLEGVPHRTFLAPDAPSEGGELELAFLLTAHDGGPLSSLPDTVVVRVRPPDNAPPEIVLEVPDHVDEGLPVRFDASQSSDPEGGRLAFSWRQIRGPGGPEITLSETPCDQPDAPAWACISFVAPHVVADTWLRIELAASDEEGISSTRTIDLLVRNTANEPPRADAGPDLVAAQGQLVEVVGSGSDPNPDDVPGLRYRWRVVSGGVDLTPDSGPVARFRAPAVSADLNVILELEVADDANDLGWDRMMVTVLANGPWISPGGDDDATGSRQAPLATVARGLDLARERGFSTLLLDGGTFSVPEQERLDGIRIKGGHDSSRGWRFPSDARSVLLSSTPLVLGEGGHLETLQLSGSIEVQGSAGISDVTIDAAAASGKASAAVEVLSGRLEVIGSRIVGSAGGAESVGILCVDGELVVEQSFVDGGAASASSRGIEARGGSLRLVNSVVRAGTAPLAEAARLSVPFDLHSSLLLVQQASGSRATALSLQAGADGALRNVILDAGGVATNRAHLRDEGGGLPQVLSKVLFGTDPACGGEAALVRTASLGGVCSAAGIANLRQGYEPLLGDPGFVAAAAGDYHLLASSPAVDAGIEEGAPASDFDGRPRGGDGNNDGFGGWDIGPFER